MFGSSVVIEDIRTLQKSGLASLAFFYCDFRDDQKKDRRGLLSSLLVQLGEQSDNYSAILSKFYEAHRRGSQQSYASDSELADCQKHAEAPRTSYSLYGHRCSRRMSKSN